MNALRNRVQLIGNLGDKIEITTFDTGKKVGRVSLATHETYKNKNGEKVEETTWHNLVLWNKDAEILEKYTTKGSEIAIEGKLTHRDFTDKDGLKRYISEVVVSNFLLLGKKRD
ncbi:single-stranded DNA-binding protein [Algoriphagus sp.]|uniref:single-stranded DNA-binding protein n=1 Tax=Algoriphagus sp. TaxID=1872435 RepID=UPI00261B7E7F|nr:single-stranded DNA-binding protein [Algoriphagus sp.]